MLRSWVLPIAALFVVTGCSFDGVDSESGSTPSDAGDRTVEFGDFGREGVDADADGAVMSLGDERFVVEAQEELVRRCMVDAGLPYAPIVGETHESLHSLGPPGPDVLTTGGYANELPAGLAESDLLLQVEDMFDGRTNDELLSTLSPAQERRWYATLYGDDDSPKVHVTFPDGTSASFGAEGCYASAVSQVFGSVELFTNYSTAAVTVLFEAREALVRQQDYQAAFAEYASCLSSHGYDLAPLDPSDPDTKRSHASILAKEFYATLSVADADARHLNLASTDADCQASTGFDHVVQTASDEVLTEVSAQLGYDLAGRQELIADAVARARDIISTS